MDAKTAVLWLRPGRHKMEHYQDDANKVADFVEQQENQILYLKANAEGEKIAREALQEEIVEHEKYAELGRLALKTMNSPKNNSITGICQSAEEYDNDCSDTGCVWIEVCQLRAELLAEVPSCEK